MQTAWKTEVVWSQKKKIKRELYLDCISITASLHASPSLRGKYRGEKNTKVKVGLWVFMSKPEALTRKNQQLGSVLLQAQWSSSAEQEKNHYALGPAKWF